MNRLTALARGVGFRLSGLRDDPRGQEMARYLDWLFLKTETRERRGALFKY